MSLPLTHPLTYESGEWVCPTTGLIVPKGFRENVRWRQRIFEDSGKRTKKADRLRQDLWIASSKSSIFWINAFAWTYRIKDVGPDGRELPARQAHVPFITWPVQDAALDDLVWCVDNGRDGLIDKSRDMGASWLVVALEDWFWLFRPESHWLNVSRIEDLVDAKGEPDSLFWKIDYLNQHLPLWMLPGAMGDFQRDGKHRTHMHLENPMNGSTIGGQATTGHVGRGGRKTGILFDEMAAIEGARAAWESASSTTSCKIANSTPIGPGTEFTRLWRTGIETGYPKVIRLGYWDHPEKGVGREPRIDEDGSITQVAGRHFFWTPWFEQELKRRTPQDVAQNILIDHVTSGSTFFNSAIVTNHMAVNGKEPRRCELVEVEIVKDGRKVSTFGFEPSSNGRWFVFCELDKNGRPEQETVYVCFGDPSHGKGAANSAWAFMDTLAGMVVAEFVDPNIGTFDQADEVATAGRSVFAGDEDECLVGWEVNGPGEDFHRDMKRHGYTHLYRQRAVGKKHEQRSKDYGWRSDRRKKRVLLTGLNRALTRGEIVIPSKAGLSELLEYVVFDDGSIGPGHLADETTGAREAHGDRAIAYAGVVMLRREASQVTEKEEEQFAPGTFGARLGHADVLASTSKWKGGE